MTTAWISGDAPPRSDLRLVAKAAFATDSSPETRLEQLASERLQCKLIAHALPLGPLADAKHTFMLRDESGQERAVAQLSNRVAPEMVRRGVERASAIRARLSDGTAAPILPALASGYMDGASFAIWRYCAPVSRPGASWLARRLLVNPVLDWLRSLLRETAQAMPTQTIDHVLGPQLCAMATDRRLSANARLSARYALRRLDRGRWRPMSVAMHGDIHLGNVLIDSARTGVRDEEPWQQRFTLIDWCGASTTGLPLYDLLRAADSLRVPQQQLGRELAVHCIALSGTPNDAEAYTAAALADLRANLECFPIDSYSALADRLLERVQSVYAAEQRVAS